MEQSGQLGSMLLERIEEDGEEAVVLDRRGLRVLLDVPAVRERRASVELLLEDHLVDDAARLEEPEGKEPVRPFVGALRDELPHRGLTVDPRILAHAGVALTRRRACLSASESCGIISSMSFAGRSRHTPSSFKRSSRSPGIHFPCSSGSHSRTCRISRLKPLRIFFSRGSPEIYGTSRIGTGRRDDT